MAGGTPAGMPLRRLLLLALATGTAYVLAARLGLTLTYYPQPVSVFWAPNAVLTAVLLLIGVRQWWVILLVAAPFHFGVELLDGVPLGMTASWYLSNCTEALIAAGGIHYFVRCRFRLNSLARLGLFIVFAIALAPVASSFLDAGLVTWNKWGGLPFWDVWRQRVFSNSLAALITIPPILSWANLRWRSIREAAYPRVLEAGVLILTLFVMSVLVVGREPRIGAPALWYLPLPLLIWAVVRFGVVGVSSAMLCVVINSMWHAVGGRGPFMLTNSAGDALSIQLFFMIAGITLLALGVLIEERQRAEDAVRRKREQLQLALDAAQMGTWDWSAEESRAWVRTAERLLAGRERNAVIYFEGFEGAVHPADLALVSQAIADSLNTGASLRVEFRVVDLHGRIRWVVTRGKTLCDPHGRPLRLMGLTADITERKRTEVLITGENHILKMISTGAAHDEILVELTKLVEAESNGVMASVLMLDADGVHVRHVAAPSLPDSYKRAVNGMAIGPRAGSCGTAMYLRKPVIVSDIATDPLWEDYRDLALRHGLRACWSVPIISDHGPVLGSFANYHREVHEPDAAEIRLMEIATHLATIVLEKRRAELDAHEQQQTLEHLSRVAILGELSGALAHELTQPLTAILSNAQAAERMLEHDPPDLNEVREILRDIVSADLRASDVIRSLRPMLMKGQAQVGLLDMNELVAETVRLAQGDLGARDVRLTILPAGNAPLVLADRVQLQQVLLNLIINACDAMRECPRAERHITVATRYAQEDHALEITLTDRGSGIPLEALSRIFDPFFTLKRDGLGLGLSICRSIVNAHQGRLWAVNNADGGATFHLMLPVAPVDLIRSELAPPQLHSAVH